MSRSMRSFVTGKTINKQVQLNNRLTTFTNPPITTGDLYVTRDLYVAGDTHLNDLDICGNLVVTGNTFLNYLDVSANVDISGNLTVTGNVYSYGTIFAKTYLPGQIVNVSMLSNSDLGQITDITIASNGRTGSGYAFPAYTYTPKIVNSYIIVEFQTIYRFDGSDVDELEAGLQVDGGTISTTYQHWLNGPGGGSRSGAIFPIVGRYTNSTISAKTIRVYVNNKTDDPLTIIANNSTWLKITEIGR